MRLLLLLCCISILQSCKNGLDQKDLNVLNGYWQIAEVEFPNGQLKKYNGSPYIEYIKVDSLKGFRKKVIPKINGSFEASNDAELFTIAKDDVNNYYIQYKTPMSTWQEALLDVSENAFSTKNGEGLIYRYRRFEPIKITP